MHKYLSWALRLLGPALLVLFLVSSDLDKLFTILATAEPGPILLSLALMPLFILTKAWRWRRILHELDIHISLPTSMGLYTVGVYLASVTPGQTGDLVKAWYLRERGYALAPALLSTVLDRLSDLLVMVGLATFGIFALGQLLPDPTLRGLLIVGMGFGLILVTVMLTARGPRQWMLTSILPAILPERLRAALERWSNQLASLSLNPRLLFAVGVASILSAVVVFYRLWLLFIALDLIIPLSIVVGVSALIAILQILPISIGGVGVRDGVLIAVLSSPVYNYTAEHALSVSVLFLLLTLEHIVVGFVVSFWYPIAVKDEG